MQGAQTLNRLPAQHHAALPQQQFQARLVLRRHLRPELLPQLADLHPQHRGVRTLGGGLEHRVQATAGRSMGDPQMCTMVSRNNTNTGIHVFSSYHNSLPRQRRKRVWVLGWTKGCTDRNQEKWRKQNNVLVVLCL